MTRGLRKQLSSNNKRIIVEQDWQSLRIYHRQPSQQAYTPVLQRIFADPDLAISSAELLKDGDSTTVVKISDSGINLVIKRYNILSNWHGLRRALRSSRAHRCWVYAHLLQEYGLQTADPVAMIEQRWGPFRKRAYYVMTYVEGVSARDLIPNASPEQRETCLQALVADLQQLYQRNIAHGDLKDTNFLWHNQHWIWLDLDATRALRNQRLFVYAWQRDIRRLLRNWQDYPQILQQAKALLPWANDAKSAKAKP